MNKIAIIGFGEAGQAFVQGWTQDLGSDRTFEIGAFDIKTGSPDKRTSEGKLADYSSYNIDGHKTVADAIKNASAIISLVTADQAFTAAQNVALSIPSGTLFFDGNSCAPSTKLKSAKLIEEAGGRYVDVAIVAPGASNLAQNTCFIIWPSRQIRAARDK